MYQEFECDQLPFPNMFLTVQEEQLVGLQLMVVVSY